MAEQTRAQLKDVINYKPQDYLSDMEVQLIKSTFKDNSALIRVIRKIMVPTVSDVDLPMEQFSHDALMAGLNYAQIPADEAKILMVARQDALQFILGGLIKLQVIANQVEETAMEAAARRTKDSSK